MSVAVDINDDLKGDEFVVLIVKSEDEAEKSEPEWNLEVVVDENEQTNIDDQVVKTEEINDTDEYVEEHTNPPKTPEYSQTLNSSYIEALTNNYLELRNDESQLVAKVADDMLNCKPEEPPEGYLIAGTLQCSLCLRSSQSTTIARRHYHTTHGPLYLSCYACGRRYRSTSHLYRHETCCKAEDIHIVLKARAIYFGEKGKHRPKLPPGVKKKKKAYKPKHSFDCTQCSARFKSKVALTTHMNLHLGKRPYQCDMCPSAYTSTVGLRRHMKKHNPENYVCDYCGHVYHIKHSLIEHMNLHLPQNKYICEYPGCDMKCTYKRTMKYHVDKVHLKLLKQFPCKLCNKRYSRADSLKTHMQAIHGLDIMTRKKFFNMLPTMPDPQSMSANAAILGDERVLIVRPECHIK